MLYYTEEKILYLKFCIFNEYSYCKNIMKKHFNKNLIMPLEEEEKFEKTYICWICNKLIENDKVRIIVILLVNLEVQHIGIVILI